MSNNPSNREFDFALVLSGDVQLTTELEDAIYGGPCDDATLSVRSGRVYLNFSRSAAKMKDAIVEAIADFKASKISGSILRVDDCNLVTQSEIARKIDRSRQLVHQYIKGERGPGGFPPPVCNVADAAPLYYWCEVAAWLWGNDIISESVFRVAQDVAVINSVLELQHQRQHGPDLAAEVARLVGAGI